MLQKFKVYLDRAELFAPQDPLLLACSGGLDSTVLAHLLAETGYTFDIAHVNFQLRGAESDGDEAFVRQLARTLEVKVHVQAVDTKTLALPGESTQMTARRLRYNYFDKLLDEYKYNFLLTAHHHDDNFETLLINLIRGTGLDGLAGMAPVNGNIVRPLLPFTHAELLSYALENELNWREDASNATDDYLRNRIRHHLAPMLSNTFELKPKSARKTITHLRQAAVTNDYLLGQLIAGHRRKTEKETTYTDDSNWPTAVREAFAYRVFKGYHFTPEQIRQLLALPQGGYLDGPTKRVMRKESSWAVKDISEVAPLLPLMITESDLPFVFRIDGQPYRISWEKHPAELNSVNGKHLYLAPPLFPLHLRPRQNGDRLQPLGMNGKSKKLKNYLIDQKIPVWHRDRLYLLTDSNDIILAITGHAVTEAGKVSTNHQTVLQLTQLD